MIECVFFTGFSVGVVISYFLFIMFDDYEDK